MLFFALISSCCYKKGLVPVINIEYVDIKTSDKDLNIYVIHTNNKTATEYDRLSSRIESSYQLELLNNKEISNYILILGDSIKTDTISNISIRNYGRCNTKMDISYEYKNSSKTNEVLKIY